jgi:hypothetical protein
MAQLTRYLVQGIEPDPAFGIVRDCVAAVDPARFL